MQSMIAHLRGKLLAKRPNQAIVEAGGVGYDLTITVPAFSDLPEAGHEVALHVHTHVREDQIALFGFLRAEEKRLFEKLISVSGIGPRMAIIILSGMPVGELIGSIRGGDIARLTKTPGIGRKTAERMVLELRDKLEEFQAAAAPPTAANVQADDVLSALVNLGYQRPLAEKAVAQAASGGDQAFERLFREALKLLQR
ncbi:MAG: Holliday junction branch migration protein RuvA [Candidatus Korobacteraceae bacterium]|jgi:Holliday junction DNA helicase RuvA